jgi:hypothetical protein
MPAPPKHDPARRNARVGVLQLPAAGRQGDPPPWPLPDKANAQERAAWRQLWATPQAHAWELLGWTRTVARYCRLLVTCESRAHAALHAQATALEDRLGLTPKAMRLLLWVIAPDEVAAQRQQNAPGARGRIRAVG